MNYNNKKLKVFVLSVCLALGTTMPKIAQAQFGGGLFGYGLDTEQKSREGLLGDPNSQGGYSLYNQQFGEIQYGGYNLYNQTFGQEVPIGSGLLILSAAGVGYALKKRNNNGNNLKP